MPRTIGVTVRKALLATYPGGVVPRGGYAKLARELKVNPSTISLVGAGLGLAIDPGPLLDRQEFVNEATARWPDKLIPHGALQALARERDWQYGALHRTLAARGFRRTSTRTRRSSWTGLDTTC